MKNRYISIVCVLLALSTLFSLAACGSGKENRGETSANSNEKEIKNIDIIVNSSSDYTVVVPAGDGGAYAVGELLVAEIKKLTGVSLRLVRDSFAKGEKEILIGNTSRPESAGLCDSLGEGDFIIKTVGEKIVITAIHSSVLKLAVKQFLGEYLLSATAALCSVSGTLDIKHTLSELPVELLLPDKPSDEEIKATLKTMKFDPKREIKANVETSRIFTPTKGWFYNHHPNVAVFGGKIYAFWSSGRVNEDDVGQKIMMAVTTDFENWDVKTLIDSEMGASTERVLTCQSVRVYNGELSVFYMGWEYEESSLRVNPDGTPIRPIKDGSHKNKTLHYISTADGVNWSAPAEIKNAGNGNSNIQELMGERLIRPSFKGVSITDDLSGHSGWKFIEIECSDEVSKHIASADTGIISECTCVQTDNGVIYLYARTNAEYVACSVSYDNGESWTPFYLTSMGDVTSRFVYGRLSDGRYYCVRNMEKGGRKQLALYFSHDGIIYDEVLLISNEAYINMSNGLYVGGGPQYPAVYIDGEYIYIIYTLGKESVSMSRIKLSSMI